MSEMVNGNGYQSARGVYVDNTLYVVKGNIIEAYDMADYQKIDDLILQKNVVWNSNEIVTDF